MNFGVPTQKVVRKVEKHPETPVLTLGAYKGKGTSYSMFVNKKAVEVLGLPENNATLAFSFDTDEDGNCTSVKVLNGSQAGIPDEVKLRVTKGNPRKASERRTYIYIANKAFDLDINVDNEFKLLSVATDSNGFESFELVLMQPEVAENTTNDNDASGDSNAEDVVVNDVQEVAFNEPLEEADMPEEETEQSQDESQAFNDAEANASVFNEVEETKEQGDSQFNPGETFGA